MPPIPAPLADFAVNFVCNGRHVGGRQDAARDALSPAAQIPAPVQVHRSIDLSADGRTVAAGGDCRPQDSRLGIAVFSSSTLPAG